MGYIVSELLKLMEKELGVTENPIGSNKQKFSRFFDVEAWQFFNTKKNPCYWCSVYVIWTLVQVLTPILGSYDAVRKWLGMPTPKNNEAAGCWQFYSYMKAKGWEIDKKKGQPGDIIFFNTSAGKCAQVGFIKRVENVKYITNEGNVYNRVSDCTHTIGSSDIYAVIHPDYESIEPKPDPEPLPHPTPDPEPVVNNLYKVVNIKTFLAIRTKPNANGKKVGELYNDAIVSVTEQQNGWGKITGDLWAYMSYLKKL